MSTVTFLVVKINKRKNNIEKKNIHLPLLLLGTLIPLCGKLGVAKHCLKVLLQRGFQFFKCCIKLLLF